MNEKRIAELMKALGCSREEAIEVIQEDELIDKGEKLYELTADQKKVVKQMTATGTKKRAAATKRERKPDEIKRQIISNVADSFQNFDFESADVAIENPERVITFTVGDDNYSLTLTRHRKKK